MPSTRSTRDCPSNKKYFFKPGHRNWRDEFAPVFCPNQEAQNIVPAAEFRRVWSLLNADAVELVVVFTPARPSATVGFNERE
jgi:hypothetical protein